MDLIQALYPASFSHRLFKLSCLVGAGLVVYFFFQPVGLSLQGWQLFVTFFMTIIAITVKPFPMGTLSILSICLLCLGKVIPLHTVLAGFGNELIWLILLACFLARSVAKTGLGRRIAYSIMHHFGSRPLSLSFAITASSLVLAPLIPSAAARAGGIILPILNSLLAVLEKEGEDKRTATFLTLATLHATIICSALFLTANVSNPIAVKMASSLGITITWCSWVKAAIVPGLVCLALLPFLLKFLIPCSIANPKKISAHAREELAKLGTISSKEIMTILVFGLLVTLWAGGPFFGISPTEAAFIGVGLLLLFDILNWKDIVGDEFAWDTFFWLAILVMMAGELHHLGVIEFFTQKILLVFPHTSWLPSLLFILFIYFYAHYFFASNTAHVSSMFAPFLAIACTIGCPPLLSAFLLSFSSSLFGGLTPYASSAAPILFAQGHVDIKTWWKIGAITSLFYLIVWLGVGLVWWKVIGLY